MIIINRYDINYVKEFCKSINLECISTEYKNIKSKLKFICNKCGNEFERNFDNVLNRKSNLCKKCGNEIGHKKIANSEKNINTELNIFGCSLVFGSYKNLKSKMSIKCSCGNIIESTISNFKNKNYKVCNECKKRINDIEALSNFEKIADSINYSVYGLKNNRERFYLVSCEKKHPKYWTRNSEINKGHRCPYCSGQKLLPENSFATHNSDKLKYWSNKNKFSPHEVSKMSDRKAWFVCENGHEWNTSVKNITLGKWCPKCANVVKLTNTEIDQVLEKQDLIRIGKYKNARSKIKVQCKICDKKFDIIYGSVHRGGGCAYCRGNSKGEKAIAKYLSDINKNFIQEYSFDDLLGIGGRKLKFDFYLTDIGVLIEFDGIYHYENMYDNNLEKIQKHDSLKNEYCEKNNIKLVRIPYWELENIEKIINNLYVI